MIYKEVLYREPNYYSINYNSWLFAVDVYKHEFVVEYYKRPIFREPVSKLTFNSLNFDFKKDSKEIEKDVDKFLDLVVAYLNRYERK